jgi:hypothetical protein
VTTYPNPGAIADVPPSPNKVESTWGNAIRDRVINSFASTAARDAAIPSPVPGQMCVIGTTQTLLQYCGATSGWCPPWNMPWGVMAFVQDTTNRTGITTLTDVPGVTTGAVTYKANRRLKITMGFCLLNSTANVANIVTLCDGANTIIIPGSYINKSTTESDCFVTEDTIVSTAGPVTYKMRASCPSGSLSIKNAVRRAFICVEDVGPNGNPI